MSTPTRHPLVEAYLDDLRRAAARLPRAQRAELVAEITAHVDAGTGGAATDAEVRNLLDDLGHPDDIVVAAAGPVPTPTRAPSWLPLVLAVVGLFSLPLPFFSIPLGVAAIITGVMARRRARAAGGTDGLATAGLVVGILAVITPIVLFVALFPVGTGASSEGGGIIVTPAEPDMEDR